MESKKLGTVIAVLGLFVFLYGGFQVLSNRPEKIEDSWDKPISLLEENARLYRKQEEAVRILIAGGVIVLFGAGVSYLNKKK